MAYIGYGIALSVHKLHPVHTQSAYQANEIHKYTTLNLFYSSPFISGLTLTSPWFWFLKKGRKFGVAPNYIWPFAICLP